MSSEFNYKHIRLPLYGFVGISKKEDAVLQTPVVQRLRRIKQLSNTYLVYPGAVHTRLEHSLGTLHLAGIVADRLKLKKSEKRVLRLAALLHDIGHGPFSHVFTTPMTWINGENYTHEDTTIFLIKHDEALSKALGREKDHVLNVFEDEGSLLHKIISSEFDIDKLDYLRRDSYHTGVAYGIYDLERILLTICKISRFGEEYFGVTEKGMRAIESYRLARFNLFEQVYEHHTRLAADDILCKSLKLAIKEGCIKDEKLRIKKENAKDFCDYFNYLDDYSLQHEILTKSNSVAREIIKCLRSRKLPKRVFRVRIDKLGIPDPTTRDRITRMKVKDIEAIEKQIAEASGISPNFVTLHLQITPIRGYRRTDEDAGISEQILIKMDNGEILSLDQMSPLTLKIRSIRKLFVFALCSKRRLNKVKEVSKEIFWKEFGIKSDLAK